MRGMAHIEEMKGGRHQIIITEIPYQVNKSTLIERIAQLVRDEKIDMISDLRDESDQRGMSIVIELKRGAQPKKVLNQLYKYTALQDTFGVQMLALVDGEPRTLSLKRALQIFIEHRQVVITRRSQFELEKARARAHILDGLLIAIANIDEVIRTIREAADVDVAKENLMIRFKLSELQAQAILDMQLRRLAALERWKIEEEARQLKEQIAFLEDLLANPKKILALVQSDMKEIAEKYGDERRTRIAVDAKEEFREEDLVHDEDTLITLTLRGYIKRVSSVTYKSQGIGGKGVTGHATKEEDEVLFMFPGRTLQTVLFFSDKGKVYSEKIYQIPDADRSGKGVSIYNVLSLDPGERITAAIAVPDFGAHDYCFLATLKGKVKRVDLEEFSSVRPSGMIAMSLENGDELGWAHLTTGNNDIMLVTEQGKAVRYSEKVVRSMGRTASGVQGIRLSEDDRVASMEVVEDGGALLTVTKEGFGKQTPLEKYPVKGRGTRGVSTMNPNALGVTGRITAARVVQPSDDLTLISSNGIVLRLKVKDVREAGRATRGVKMMRLLPGDTVAAVARIASADLKKAGAAENGDAETEKEQPPLL
jgi:DNA gyrase subunit A